MAKCPYGNVHNDNKAATSASAPSSSGCICHDSPGNLHPFGTQDRSCSTLGTPFFPLVESGLDGVSGELVGALPDLEFGGPQQLGIGFGGHDACHVENFLLGFLADDRRDPLGLC